MTYLSAQFELERIYADEDRLLLYKTFKLYTHMVSMPICKNFTFLKKEPKRKSNNLAKTGSAEM